MRRELRCDELIGQRVPGRDVHSQPCMKPHLKVVHSSFPAEPRPLKFLEPTSYQSLKPRVQRHSTDIWVRVGPKSLSSGTRATWGETPEL